MTLRGVAMEAEQLIEHELRRILDFATQAPLSTAAGGGLPLRYSRRLIVRPRLTLAVAQAHGNRAPGAALAYAAALELMHCASLIHDDLPCFDNAKTRREHPALHREFGEPPSVAHGRRTYRARARWLALRDRTAGLCCGAPQSAGLRRGGPGGESLLGKAGKRESENRPSRLSRGKNRCALFCRDRRWHPGRGGEAMAWERLGARLGEAYQVADDLRDALGDSDELGKPRGGRSSVRAAQCRASAWGRRGGSAASGSRRRGARFHSALSWAPSASGHH